MAKRTTLSDVLGSECCEPDCGAPAMEDAPFPICDRHYIAVVRHFQQSVQANGLAVDYWSTAHGLGEVPREERANVPEYVYFIRYRDRIKIGTSTNPRKRLAGLPYDDLLAVIPGGRSVEREWHQRYEGHRDQGEWFTYTDGMLDTIRALGTYA